MQTLIYNTSSESLHHFKKKMHNWTNLVLEGKKTVFMVPLVFASVIFLEVSLFVKLNMCQCMGLLSTGLQFGFPTRSPT